MATISENLQTIKNSIDAIKQAIIDKGGTIEGDITTWADAINNIESGGNYVILISFTINGTSYQAEDGMTWRDWWDSKYNTSTNYHLTSSTVSTGSYNVAYNNIDVALTDVIVNNRKYVHRYVGGYGGGSGEEEIM